jgi:hypothetical protein
MKLFLEGRWQRSVSNRPQMNQMSDLNFLSVFTVLICG